MLLLSVVAAVILNLPSGNVVSVGSTDSRGAGLYARLSTDGGKKWSAGCLNLEPERSGFADVTGRVLSNGLIRVEYVRNSRGTSERLTAQFREDDVRYGRLLTGEAKIRTILDAGGRWDWIPGSELPQEGRGWKNTSSPYVRLPDHLKGIVPSGVWNLSRHSSGIVYRFRTDSKALRIHWTVSDRHLGSHNLTAAGKSGVDVYARSKGGDWHFVKGSRPMAPTNEIELKWTPGDECMIYLPLYNVVLDFAVAVTKGATIERLPVRNNGVVKPVVCYGTSITHGASASRPGLCWTAIAARKADVPLINLGFAGSAKMEMSMERALAEVDASLYVIDSLWNMDEKMVKERYEPFVRALHTARPETPILCVEDCSSTEDRTAKGRIVESLVSRLKVEDSRLWANLHFMTNLEEMERDGEETVDGCHPNDRGHKSMGEGFARKFVNILCNH